MSFGTTNMRQRQEDYSYNRAQHSMDLRTQQNQDQARAWQRAAEQSERERAQRVAREHLYSSSSRYRSKDSDSDSDSDTDFGRELKERASLKPCPIQEAYTIKVFVEKISAVLGKSIDQVKPHVTDGLLADWLLNRYGEVNLSSLAWRVTKIGEKLKCKVWDFRSFGNFEEGALERVFTELSSLNMCKHVQKIILGRQLTPAESGKYAQHIAAYKPSGFFAKPLVIEVHPLPDNLQERAFRYRKVLERVAIMVHRPVEMIEPHLSEQDSRGFYYTAATDCFGITDDFTMYDVNRVIIELKVDELDLRVWNTTVCAYLDIFFNNLSRFQTTNKELVLKYVTLPRHLHQFEFRAYQSKIKNYPELKSIVFKINETPINIQEELAALSQLPKGVPPSQLTIHNALNAAKPLPPLPPQRVPAAAVGPTPDEEEILEAK